MAESQTGARRLRILFVAQAVSIHTARWIRQVEDEPWDLHVFDMLGSFPHPELRGITEYSLLFPRRIPASSGEVSYGHPFFLRRGWDPFPLSLAGFWIRRSFRGRVKRLADLIQKLQPDIIHSLELQTESYHVLDAVRLLGGSLLAPWIVTTWGSDIFYFQHFPQHLDKIKEVLQKCDYLIPDCQRDEALAREYGFAGIVPFILPGAGGYPIERMRHLMSPGSVSGRRLIMLKGYQGWAGKALIALDALEACAHELEGYEIVVYAASPVVEQRVRAMQRAGPLRMRLLPRSSHETVLEHFGRARLALGVNSTDGVPNAMLEAMTMGAFPIQSDTQSTAEWITDGENGLLVRPDEAANIANAVRRGVADDPLIDRAAQLNYQLVARRLDIAVVKPKVVEMYRTIAETSRGQKP